MGALFLFFLINTNLFPFGENKRNNLSYLDTPSLCILFITINDVALLNKTYRIITLHFSP